MPVLELAILTWEEVRDLDRATTVALLPVGALEAHGPHLPLATDVVIAEAMARSAADKLAARGLGVLLLPTLAYTAAGFAAGFPGTVSLGPTTVTATLVDIARSLTQHGFSLLAVANSHLDPAHLASLEAAVTASRDAQLLTLVCPDITQQPWALRLTEEFKSGACHAGRYESSVVLAARPELVREGIRRALPANPRSLAAAIRAGQRTFEEAGGPRAYFGYPADAGADEGQRTLDVLGAILAEAVLAELAR